MQPSPSSSNGVVGVLMLLAGGAVWELGAGSAEAGVAEVAGIALWVMGAFAIVQALIAHFAELRARS